MFFSYILQVLENIRNIVFKMSFSSSQFLSFLGWVWTAQCITANIKHDPMFSCLMLEWYGRRTLEGFKGFPYTSTIFEHLLLKSHPRRHPFYNNMAKIVWCLTKFLLSFYECSQTLLVCHYLVHFKMTYYADRPLKRSLY